MSDRVPKYGTSAAYDNGDCLVKFNILPLHPRYFLSPYPAEERKHEGGAFGKGFLV